MRVLRRHNVGGLRGSLIVWRRCVSIICDLIEYGKQPDDESKALE